MKNVTEKMSGRNILQDKVLKYGLYKDLKNQDKNKQLNKE